MTFKDQLAADARTMLNPNEFAEACTYAPPSGSPVAISAVIDRGMALGSSPSGMDKEFAGGLAGHAVAHVHMADVEPVQGALLTDEAGVEWTVRQWRPLNGMWALYLTTDERGGW